MAGGVRPHRRTPLLGGQGSRSAQKRSQRRPPAHSLEGGSRGIYKTAELVFLAEALKAKQTGKHTSTREMTESGNWTQADVSKANAEAGRIWVENFTAAAVQFIETWKKLRPLHPAEK